MTVQKETIRKIIDILQAEADDFLNNYIKDSINEMKIAITLITDIIQKINSKNAVKMMEELIQKGLAVPLEKEENKRIYEKNYEPFWTTIMRYERTKFVEDLKEEKLKDIDVPPNILNKTLKTDKNEILNNVILELYDVFEYFLFAFSGITGVDDPNKALKITRDTQSREYPLPKKIKVVLDKDKFTTKHQNTIHNIITALDLNALIMILVLEHLSRRYKQLLSSPKNYSEEELENIILNDHILLGHITQNGKIRYKIFPKHDDEELYKIERKFKEVLEKEYPREIVYHQTESISMEKHVYVDNLLNMSKKFSYVRNKAWSIDLPYYSEYHGSSYDEEYRRYNQKVMQSIKWQFEKVICTRLRYHPSTNYDAYATKLILSFYSFLLQHNTEVMINFHALLKLTRILLTLILLLEMKIKEEPEEVKAEIRMLNYPISGESYAIEKIRRFVEEMATPHRIKLFNPTNLKQTKYFTPHEDTVIFSQIMSSFDNFWENIKKDIAEIQSFVPSLKKLPKDTGKLFKTLKMQRQILKGIIPLGFANYSLLDKEERKHPTPSLKNTPENNLKALKMYVSAFMETNIRNMVGLGDVAVQYAKKVIRSEEFKSEWHSVSVEKAVEEAKKECKKTHNALWKLLGKTGKVYKSI